MCGLVGLVSLGDRGTLDRMTDILSHRGPDDRGIWVGSSANGQWIGLGSRRLAILDLSPAGHMPMSTPDGRITIAYNGELYNAPALREELELKGYKFRSRSDTEVALYAYQEYGNDCPRRFNGIFAFAIWDSARDQLFMARDHFGIKPLYYFHKNRQLALASEIKALLQLPEIPRQINLHALHQYLTFLWVPDPLTLFEGIFKLPAGHFATWKDGRLELGKYWELTFPDANDPFSLDEATLTSEIRDRFARVVESQMISDVPLGAFLSAGIDSSSIVAAMAGKSSQPVRTFTIAFPEKYRRGELTLDDPAVAVRTAKYFGCQHTEIEVEPNVVDLLPKLVWHMDEPTADPAIIMAYLVNREARKEATVLLSGVGGDELFAGYRKYQAHYLAQQYRKIPRSVREHILEPAINALPGFRGSRFKGHVRLAKKMARSGRLAPIDRFLMDSVYLSDSQKHELYSETLRSQLDHIDARSTHLLYFDKVANADFLNQMLYVDTKTFMVSLNLNYNDKMSMASSVEVRVPFLDWEFAEWVAANVPPDAKLKKGITKYIFREAMRPLLPPEVLAQKKAGFGAPVDYWLAHDLRPMVDELLSEGNIRRRGLFRPSVIRRYIEDQRSGREDWSLQIWQFLTLEVWMREFLNQSSDSPL